MRRGLLHLGLITALVIGSVEASARASGERLVEASPSLLPRPGALTGSVLNDRIRQRAQEARRLAMRYLDHWSRREEVTSKHVQEFYAPTVRFHGRVVAPKDLLDEKRRFARRWPLRDYSPLAKTMSIGCRADAGECRVETSFSYRARNPVTGQSAKGYGLLQLVIDFASGRPLIISESSRVLRQS